MTRTHGVLPVFPDRCPDRRGGHPQLEFDVFPEITKVCTGCEKEKNLADFHRSSSGLYGRGARCKSCTSAYCRLRSLLPKEVHPFKVCLKCGEEKSSEEFNRSKYTRDGRQSGCKDCYRTYNLARRGLSRARRLLRKYGLSMHDYIEMAAAQGHVCFVCGGINKNGQPLGVDHCHTSGKVRGLLCAGCNTGLANFQDSPELCEKAAEYLRNSARFVAA